MRLGSSTWHSPPCYCVPRAHGALMMRAACASRVLHVHSDCKPCVARGVLWGLPCNADRGLARAACRAFRGSPCRGPCSR